MSYNNYLSVWICKCSGSTSKKVVKYNTVYDKFIVYNNIQHFRAQYYCKLRTWSKCVNNVLAVSHYLLVVVVAACVVVVVVGACVVVVVVVGAWVVVVVVVGALVVVVVVGACVVVVVVVGAFVVVVAS